MPGLGSWRVCGFLAISACGGRSTLDSWSATESRVSPTGGAPGLAPTAMAGRDDRASAGAPSGGDTASSGGMATIVNGMATAGAAAVPGVPTMISAGTDMSCATTRDGSAWCWGTNEHGQLGNGSETSSWLPVRVRRINSAVAISAGGTWNQGGKGAASTAFACAVLRNGKVVCWGHTFGNSDLDRSAPHTISGVNDAVAVACGNAHACALTSTGTVWCWGANDSGQLGTGTTDPGGPTPVQVQGIVGATAVAGQGSEFSCAVQTEGSVWCWGKYNGGTDFGSSMYATSPVRVSGVSSSASGLAVGRSDACAVSRGGENLQCWGLDYSNAGPVTVRGLRAPLVAVSEGAQTTCALLNDQTVQCWGEGRRGQLGNDAHFSSDVPVDVVGVTDAVAVSVGYLHACALSKTGHVRCWGANDGGLGSGSPNDSDSLRPVTVTGF